MEQVKKQIKIEVKDKVATLVSMNFNLVGGNSDYEVVFEFDGDWENYPVKTAVFVYGNHKPVYQVVEGNICKGVAIENATMCLVGAFAGDIMTTTPAEVPCVRRSILDEANGVPEAPTHEIYNQIMELLQKAIQAHTELPIGGKTGQILKKKSDEDYDTEWADDEKGTTVDLSNYYDKTQTDELLGKKLDSKASKYKSKVYGIDDGNQDIVYDISTGVYAYAIARRGNGGNILVPLTPTSDGHATSKAYVDGLVLGVEEELQMINEGGLE